MLDASNGDVILKRCSGGCVPAVQYCDVQGNVFAVARRETSAPLAHLVIWKQRGPGCKAQLLEGQEHLSTRIRVENVAKVLAELSPEALQNARGEHGPCIQVYVGRGREAWKQ